MPFVDADPAHDQPIDSLEALLRATGFASLQEFSRGVDDDLELDATVREVVAGDGPGVEIVIYDTGVLLPYTFTLAEFWEAVEDLEEQTLERIESQYREETRRDGLEER